MAAEAPAGSPAVVEAEAAGREVPVHDAGRLQREHGVPHLAEQGVAIGATGEVIGAAVYRATLEGACVWLAEDRQPRR